MKGRERFIKLFNGDQVDRVPVSPFIYNNFIYEFFGSSDIDPVEKGIEVYKHFGFDIILRTCNVWDYLDEKFCSSSKWRVEEVKTGQGREWTVITTIKTPERELVQKKKYKKITENEVLDAIVEYYIKDEADFEQFIKFQPPVPEYDCSVIRRARELLGDDGLAAPWAQGAFNSASFYRKLDDLIMDPYDNPAFYEKMMQYFSGRMLEVIGQFAAAGADIICAGGNVGNSSMVGPKFFKDYILPYEIDFARKAKAFGVFYLYHNCGDAALLLDFYPKIGMTVYESLTSAPYGDTRFEDALAKIDRKIILCGNIDQIDFLKKASPEEIKCEVRRILALAKKRGGFILAATDYFSEGTPYKNIKAFSEAGLEFGGY